jgi:hypothetical protein
MTASLARWRLLGILALVMAAGWGGVAQAARSYTYVQAPAIGTQFDMGSTQSLAYTITNTATGGNAGERIYEMRFRISSGSLFSASTVAPAGWTRTAFSTTSITFRANSWANAIPVGGSVGFTLAVAMRTATTNVNETLRDIRGRFTNTTTGPPFNLLASITTNTPGGWTLMALAITSFQITDLLGTPITALTAGSSFRLVMTVRNNSSATQNNIVSNPNPPTAVETGTVTQVLTGTVGSPLNLAAGASGTITFTFSTAATDQGTISFTAQARNGATVTSRTATSTTLAVGRFSASLSAAPTCQYVGANVTVTMALTDGYPYSILNVTPTLTPVAGAPVTYLSGPTPASPIPNVPVSPPDTLVAWTYQVNAVGTTDPFTFSGSATGTGNTAGSPVHTTPPATSASVARGEFPAAIGPAVVNAGSTNVEMTVTITNNGCAAVNSVAITSPAGWTGAGDAYSLVNLSAVNAIETWTAGGANPVVFTAPNVAGQMPVTFSGDFSIVYAATPAGATTSAFTVRVTDANGNFLDIPLNVTVNAFKSGSLNDAANRASREDFR